jgi:hypothetical protein
MNNSVSSKPIEDQSELKIACDSVCSELSRINPYLKQNKQQGKIDLLVNAPIGDTKLYDPKLKWLALPMDEKLIKDQLVYIQYLRWQKQVGIFNTQLHLQINKSISIATGSIIEVLTSHAYTKVTGAPAETLGKHLQKLKYFSLISLDLETKSRSVWDQRQTIHLQLRNDEQKFHTDANIETAISTVDLVVDHWHNHFQLAVVGIHKKYK